MRVRRAALQPTGIDVYPPAEEGPEQRNLRLDRRRAGDRHGPSFDDATSEIGDSADLLEDLGNVPSVVQDRDDGQRMTRRVVHDQVGIDAAVRLLTRVSSIGWSGAA
jgi:hypothetical protein